MLSQLSQADLSTPNRWVNSLPDSGSVSDFSPRFWGAVAICDGKFDSHRLTFGLTRLGFCRASFLGHTFLGLKGETGTEVTSL